MEDHLDFAPVWELSLPPNIGPDAVDEYTMNRTGGLTNPGVDYVSL